MAKKETTPTWEIKDRFYYLTNGNSPLTFRLQTRHSARNPLLYFDEEKGYQKELRYATNQPTAFVEDQKGTATLGNIVFKDGVLFVPKENQVLQKLLSIYHPKKNLLYKEQDAQAEAKADLDYFDLELEAGVAAKEIGIDLAEAILRVEYGSQVNKMTSSEIKRDIRLFARNNPKLFLDLANDDHTVLKNTAHRAIEEGIVKLKPDGRTIAWKANGKKILTVPFDEEPQSALAAYFKTDEGLEVLKSVEKKLA